MATTQPTIPTELIEDILRRLPVKSLKRFRSVSKSFRYLIDTPSFIKSHYRHSLITNSNRSLILAGLAIYTVNLNPLSKALLIKPPFYYRSVDSISNSCNGLILVTSDPPVIWNVFTKSYKILPKSVDPDSETDPDTYSRTTYGFGYDSKNDDYKVVKVLEYRSSETPMWIRSECKIFGVKSNTWRRIDSFPYSLPFLRGHWRVHVNGALHTITGGGGNEVRIMAFSVENEEHYEVKMPKGIVGGRSLDLSLDVIEGELVLVCGTRSRVVVWIMKEYGKVESWRRLFTMRQPEDGRFDFVRTLCYDKDKDKVLLNCDDKKLVWFDLRRKCVEEVCVDGQPFVFYAEPCVESLVEIDGVGGGTGVEKRGIGGGVKLGVEKRKGRKIGNKRDDFLSEGFKLVL